MISPAAGVKHMPLRDKDFGKKLAALEQAVGFRFPPSDFQNTFLSSLLHTTPETMSRKKTGVRRVTESDWSILTEYFDLARYGFEPGMFAEDLDAFLIHMKDVARLALQDSKPNKARLDLYELATGPCGGRLRIDLAGKGMRGGGIGAAPVDNNIIVLRIGDEVVVRTSARDDGHLFLFNDERGREFTCLMPSYFAPETAVRKGQVSIPTVDEFRYFPVGGPANTYRLYALWFAEKPDFGFLSNYSNDASPRVLTAIELTEVASCAKMRSANEKAVMVAIADYEVR